MKNKFFLAAILGAVMALSLHGANFSVVHKGRPAITIKIAGTFHPAITFAVEDFYKILNAYTNTAQNRGGWYHLTIGLAGNNTCPAADKAMKENKLSSEKLGSDGFLLVHLKKNHYLLCAYQAKGVMNGLYRILEKNIGCVIPRPEAGLNFPYIAVKQTPIKTPYWEKPQFSFRGFSISSAIWRYDNPVMHTYMVRNYFNTPGNGPQANEARSGVMQKYAFLPVTGGHTFHYWLPASIYAKEHPEYYSVDKDGKPTKKFYHGAQLALGHPDVVRILTERILTYLKDNPDTRCIPFGYNDSDGGGFGWGDDQWSVKLDSPKDFPKPGSKRPRAYSTRYIKTANKIISEVCKKYPDMKMHVYAYHWPMMQAPDCEVHPNLIVEFAPLYKCGVHAINDPNCYRNRIFAEHLTNWAKKTPNVYFRDYYYAGRHHPLLPLTIIKKDLQFFKSIGIIGARPEISPDAPNGANLRDDNPDMPRWLRDDQFCRDRWDSNALSYFVFSRLLWDPEQDIEKLVNLFCINYYGSKGGPLMAKYFMELEKLFYQSGKPGVKGKPVYGNSDFVNASPWCFCWNWEHHPSDFSARIFDLKAPAAKRKAVALKLNKLLRAAGNVITQEANRYSRERYEREVQRFRIFLMPAGLEISNLRPDNIRIYNQVPANE